MSKLPSIRYEVQSIDGVGVGKKGDRCRIVAVRWVQGRKEVVQTVEDDIPCEEADARCAQMNSNLQ